MEDNDEVLDMPSPRPNQELLSLNFPQEEDQEERKMNQRVNFRKLDRWLGGGSIGMVFYV